MAKKIFISYKYKDDNVEPFAEGLVTAIIKAVEATQEL